MGDPGVGRHRRRILVALTAVEQNEEIRVPEGSWAPDWDAEISHVMFEHNHLPLLEAMELISWNKVKSTVSPGTKFDVIRPLLELLDEHQHELPGQWI